MGHRDRRSHMVEQLTEALGGLRLLVVSNREPYAHQKTKTRVVCTQSVGGLVAALDPLLRACGGVWVAWGSGNRDTEYCDSEGRLMVPPGEPLYSLRRIWLSEDEVENYYYGFCNRAIWPLCHLLVERTRFRQRFWDCYSKVNQRFAQAVLDEIQREEGPPPLLWLQDYHLALCPRMVKEKEPDTLVTLFWHIPWPPADVFRICPQRREILEGLLGCDLLGFHISNFCKNFLDCCVTELRADVDYQSSTVTWRGHVTTVGQFPISIDFDSLDSVAASARVEKLMKAVSARYHLEGKKVGIGVDRLDYTKGIPERLRAIDLFFSKYPHYRGQFTFLQLTAPSRTEIGAYQRLKEQIKEGVQSINEKYGAGPWSPVLFIEKKITPQTLAACYRLADLAIVSSLHDGMNLVAKEYVACQTDEKGALVLSELAGVFPEIKGTVAINPFDPEGFADAIRQALEMAPEERAKRMEEMRQLVKENDIFMWMLRYISRARGLHS